MEKLRGVEDLLEAMEYENDSVRFMELVAELNMVYERQEDERRRSFFANRSIGEIMPKVKPMHDLSVLAGGIPDEDDVDELVEIIYAARK